MGGRLFGQNARMQLYNRSRPGVKHCLCLRLEESYLGDCQGWMLAMHRVISFNLLILVWCIKDNHVDDIMPMHLAPLTAIDNGDIVISETERGVCWWCCPWMHQRVLVEDVLKINYGSNKYIIYQLNVALIPTCLFTAEKGMTRWCYLLATLPERILSRRPKWTSFCSNILIFALARSQEQISPAEACMRRSLSLSTDLGSLSYIFTEGPDTFNSLVSPKPEIDKDTPSPPVAMVGQAYLRIFVMGW